MEKNIKIGLKSTLPYFFFIVALAGTACFNKGKPSFSLTKEVHNGVVEKPTHTVANKDYKTSEQDQSQDLDASMATEAVQPVSMHMYKAAEQHIQTVISPKKPEITLLNAESNQIKSNSRESRQKVQTAPQASNNDNNADAKQSDPAINDHKTLNRWQEIKGKIEKEINELKLEKCQKLLDKLKGTTNNGKGQAKRKKLCDKAESTIKKFKNLEEQLKNYNELLEKNLKPSGIQLDSLQEIEIKVNEIIKQLTESEAKKTVATCNKEMKKAMESNDTKKKKR